MIYFFVILIIIICFILSIKFLNENFIEECLGKRDGVSGCRNCCKKYRNNYNNCVNNCMNY